MNALVFTVQNNMVVFALKHDFSSGKRTMLEDKGDDTK